MFEYVIGAVVCVVGIQRLAIHLWAGLALSREGKTSRGLATMRIGLFQGVGLVAIGAQFILVGYWGDYRSMTLMIVGAIMIAFSLILRLLDGSKIAGS